MDEFLKNKSFLIKFFGWAFLLLIIIGGIWYWQLFTKKPEFHPIKMALSSDENSAYIVSTEGLAVFDNSKNKISITPALFGPDANIIISGVDNRIYIANRLSDNISVYKDGALLKEIVVGSKPEFIFINDRTQKLFVFNRLSQNLNVIDTKNYTIIATIEIGNYVSGGVLDEKSNYLYLMTEDGRLLVISGDSLKISKVISVGAFPGGYDQTPFDEINQRMYFVSKSDGQLWIIDTALGKAISNIKIPLGSEVMTVGPTKKKLYIANSEDHAVFIFDTKDLSVKKISLSPLLYPQVVLADEKNGKLYVYSFNRVNEITVLDMEGKILKNIPVGYPLSDFNFSPKTETLYALSRNGGFMMTMKNDEEPKFTYGKPEVFETKLSWPIDMHVGINSKRLYALSDFSNNYLAFERDKLNLISSVSLGGGPYQVFFSGQPLNKTYILNKGINEIWGINVTEDGKMSVGKKIKVEKNTFSGIGLNTLKKLYITSDDSIIVIDAEKDEIIKTIPMDGKPEIIGADQERNKIFVNINNDSLLMINGDSDIVSDSLKISIGKKRFDATNSRIYVLGANGKLLNVINSVNLKILKSVNLDFSYNEIAVAPWLKKLYLLGSSKNELLVLDGDLLKKVGSVNIKGSSSGVLSQATAIYPDEKTNKIFLAHRYGQITVIDAASNKITNTIKLPYAANPVSLKTDPDNNRLYVANKWLNQVQVYSLKDYLLQAEINIKGETQWFK